MTFPRSPRLCPPRPHRFLSLLGVLSLSWFPQLHLASAAPHIAISRHAPCNLFEPGEAAVLQARLKGFPAGNGEALAILSDENGKEVLRKKLPYKTVDGKETELAIDLGNLGRGYYDLRVTTGSPAAEKSASLGVMEFVNRTAKEVREGGYIFGLKWWDGVKNKTECLDAMAKLGLQWTRVVHNQKGDVPTDRMLKEFPINAAVKVERFPKELYDEVRYGPLAEWEVKYGKGTFVLKTLPKKEPYQVWLREYLAKLPPEQQIFEIWNEPWDKMSPEDFATLSQWILEVILKDRPNAIVGPNLMGNTSPYEYDARVIKAGGLAGMKMVALHPYGGSEDRQWMRDYRAWLKRELGRDMDIHITEYGSHSTPEGPVKRSELEQARRVVRQSLALYAEGVKSLIPHVLGQAEQNRTYVEDWYGFVRKNEEPKPVLIAHANTARLIDGSRYLGDLWYGPGVGAMLFERNGTHTLALWTLGDARNSDSEQPSRDVEVTVDVPKVELVRMGGQSSQETAQDGKLHVTLSEAPLYLVGVSPELSAQASTNLRADRWPKPEKPIRTVRNAGRMKARPTLDGKFEDWPGAAQLGMVNPKVAGADCIGAGYVSWDTQFLYLGVDIRDNEVLNKQARAKLYRQDSLEVFLSTEPRDSGRGFGPRDYQLFITPTSGEGQPVIGRLTDREAGVCIDVKGAESLLGPGGNGWRAEIAIPWSTFDGFKPESGAKLALEFRVNDADSSHERFKIDPLDGSPDPNDPSVWSYLVLKD